MFCSFNLYCIEEYRNNLKQLPAYDFFITKIAQDLRRNNDFFDITKNYNLTYNKHSKIKFHDFIFKEAAEIQQQELNQFDQKSKKIEKEWLEKPKNTIQESTYNASNKTLNYVNLLKELHKTELHIKNSEHASFYKKRINSLEQTINGQELIKTNYIISPITQAFLDKHSIDTNQFEQFVGNQLQHSLHCEFLYVIERAASIWHENQNNKNVQDFVSTTAHFTEIGFKANNNDLIELASDCADAGHYLLAFFEGCKNAILANGDFFKNIVIHPIETGKEIIKTIADVSKVIFPIESAISSSATDVIFAISKVFIKMQKVTNDLTFNQITPEKLSSSIEKIKVIQQGLFEYETNDLKEKIINVLHQSVNNFMPRFDTQLIIPILINVGTNAADKMINASNEKRFEAAGYLITDATLNFVIFPELILKPLGTIGLEATKLINLGLKKGATVTLEAIESIKQNPKLIKNINNISTAVDATIGNIENLKQYYLELIKYENIIATNGRLKNFLKNAKIPEFFVPAESTIKRLQLVQNEEYFVDILGNKLRVSINPSISEIELSETTKRMFNFNDQNPITKNKISTQEFANQLNSTEHIKESVKNSMEFIPGVVAEESKISEIVITEQNINLVNASSIIK